MGFIKIVNITSGYGVFLCALYYLIIYPIVMNNLVIKRIEKKFGVPLNFCLPIYDLQMGGYYLRGYEIANYIVAECFGLGCYFNSQCALKQIKYSISMAGKCEIIWSFITVFSELGGLIFFILFALTTS